MKESRRNFIKKSTGAAAAITIPGIFPYSTEKGKSFIDSALISDDDLVMRTGFAELDITPELGMERPGNYMKAYHRSFHDPCKVRAFVCDDGKKRSAIVGIDALIVPRSVVVTVREQIKARCGIPYEAILIGASHSHSSGPVGMVQPGEYDHASPLVKSLAYDESSCADQKYLKLVEKKLVDVVCKADNSLQESLLGVGTGFENKAGANRRFQMKNGLTFTYPGRGNPDIIEPAGPIDPEVGVIGVWDKNDKCIGCVVNFARHANSSPGGISAGWIYFMEQTIRGAMGPDCIVVFLAGASGDVSHDHNNPYASLSGTDRPRYIGGLVGAEAVKVLMSMPRGVMLPVDFKVKVMGINRRAPDPERVRKCYELVKKPAEKIGITKWRFAKEVVLLDALLEKQSKVQVEVQTLQIGPVVFVTNPAEYFCQFGLNIKNKSPFKFTFPVSLANGSVGYVPTEEAFGPNGGGYETRLTSYSNLEITAGNKIAEAGIELARQMKPGIEPKFPEARPFKAPWDYGDVKPELE